MWPVINSVAASLNLKRKEVNTDNYVFKLHYRLTFWSLIVTTGLIWTADIFGDKLKCGHSRAEDVSKTNERLDHVINSYCMTLGLFTIPRHHHPKNASNNEVKYPGVGPFDEKDEVRRLNWYQWVHYVLLFQALSFYVPRLVWRIQENKTLLGFVKGFRNIHLLSKEDAELTLVETKRGFFYRVRLYQDWAKWLTFCEVLNFLNVVLQWFLTDWFLQGYFSKLGNAQNENFSYIDVAFPKMAKCSFLQIGPSGSLQETDVFCLLTYNLVYEKIYQVLWYWYIFLITLSAMAIVHRLVSYFSFKTRFQYNSNLCEFSVFNFGNPQKDIPLIIERVSYYDWIFLQYLLANLENKLAAELVAVMATTIRNEKMA